MMIARMSAMANSKKALFFHCLFISCCFGEDNPCQEYPCENGGKCFEKREIKRGYMCSCTKDYAGHHCNLPKPSTTCGKRSIEIEIDKRILEEMELSGNASHVHFANQPDCHAVIRGLSYHLEIDAPFLKCGVSIKNVDGNFIFRQSVVWNTLDKVVERPLILLNFQCSYKGSYQVLPAEMKPTVTTIDFKTTYGVFTLMMDLYRNRDFNDRNKLSLRPVVEINEDICIRNKIAGALPEHLVLTTGRCWASKERDGSGDFHNLITDKCSADPINGAIISNGRTNFSDFCFTLFKWKESMNSIYLHCLVRICNTTSSTKDECICPSERQKRNINGENWWQRQSEDDSTWISSEQIRIVNAGYLDNWLKFLEETDDNFSSRVHAGNALPSDENVNTSTSNTTVLVVIGVVLLVVIVVLGITIGVVVNHRRMVTKRRKPDPAGADQSIRA